jgi:hypothetical protein
MTESSKRIALLSGIGAAAGLAGWKLMSRGRQPTLKGQVVVITGGSRGLGFELAHEFATREPRRSSLHSRV